MPKARPSVAPAEAATGAAPAADAEELFSRFDEAWKTLGPGVAGLLASAKRANGAQDLGCSCAKCLRKAGPVREDSEERILHITHVLADVYEETPNPEERIKPHHRQRARQFMAAVEANDVERLEAYFQECPEEHRGEIVGELVISASQAGHTDILRCLAKHATDDDYLDMSDSSKGARPLMFAAHNGHVAAVRLLLELGADPNATDDHGYNALTISTFCDRAGVAEVLCQYKDTIIDQLDERDRTAMCYAALYGSDNCVHVLAAHGADVFHRDDEQADPLELAEQSGRSSTADAIRKLQLKAKLAMRRAERKADAAGRAAACALDDKERARREAEAEARAAELLAECQREKKAKERESERRRKLKKQQQAEEATRRNARKLAIKATSSSAGSDQDSLTDQRRELYCDGNDAHAMEEELSRAILSVADIGLEHDNTIKQEPGSLQGNGVHDTNGHANNGNGEGHYRIRLPPESATEPVLRKAFDALVDEAKDCKETSRQQAYIDAIKTLIPRAAALGISVKYGKKVLQRLETVQPAKAALLAALTTVPVQSADLEAALKLARPAACLLDPDLVSNAESALVACKAAEQQQEAERQLQIQQQQQAQSHVQAPLSPRSPRIRGNHHMVAQHHGTHVHGHTHHPQGNAHPHHTQHQPGHHPTSPRHSQQHRPWQVPPPPPLSPLATIASTISAAQPHSPTNRRPRHEPRSPRAAHIFDGHAKAQTRTNAWQIPHPSPPAAKQPPPPPPPPVTPSTASIPSLTQNQNQHDLAHVEQHTAPPDPSAMTPQHDACRKSVDLLPNSPQVYSCNFMVPLHTETHSVQQQGTVPADAMADTALPKNNTPPANADTNQVAENGVGMDAPCPEAAVMGHALQPAHAPVLHENGFACHAPALMSHHIPSQAGQHKASIDTHPADKACFHPLSDTSLLSAAPASVASEFNMTSYMASHLANANTSIPSPTAPLSVAAAALDLGGLSLSGLNSWHTGLNGLASDNMQFGGQNLLVALHNNHSSHSSAINSSLPSSMPSAAAGFNTPGCLAVPPALTALWSKPVAQVSNGATATYSSTGTNSSYTGLPGSPLKSVVSLPTPPAGGLPATISTQQSLTPTESTVKVPTPPATTLQPAQPAVPQPVYPPAPPPQPPLQKRLSQPNHINQHHHQMPHHNVQMMGGHGHGIQNGMRPMQGGHMQMHSNHNQYHMRPHAPPNMSMHVHVQPQQQHVHGMHAHNMYGHVPGHVQNTMMDGRHTHQFGPMQMHAEHVSFPHHQVHGHPHLSAKSHHMPNMARMTPFAEVACTVCGTNEKNAVCWPCHHTCMCLRCATVRLANRGSCPVCRVGLENVYEVGASLMG